MLVRRLVASTLQLRAPYPVPPITLVKVCVVTKAIRTDGANHPYTGPVPRLRWPANVYDESSNP